MTPQQAKEILLLYRPNTSDANDPEFSEALALVEQDAELRVWFRQHCAFQTAVRDRMRQIPIPDGLREQIISEHKADSVVVWWQRSLVLAAAAILVAMITLAVFWTPPPPSAPADLSLSAYRNRMVRTALKTYTMEIESSDIAEVRNYFARQQSPSDFELPEGLKTATCTGGAITTWQNVKVSMICFRTGKPLPPGVSNDLWFFVIERAPVTDAPGPEPIFTQVNKLQTASWTKGDKLYLLGTEGDLEAIRKYL